MRRGRANASLRAVRRAATRRRGAAWRSRRAIARRGRGCASARNVARKLGSASGPVSVAWAFQAGMPISRACVASCCALSCSSSANGARLAICARPVARRRSQLALSASMRCCVPAVAPSWSCACRSRSGVAPSGLTKSSPTRSERTASSTGNCRSAGGFSGSLLLLRRELHVDAARAQFVDLDVQPGRTAAARDAQPARHELADLDAIVAAGQADRQAACFEVAEQRALRRLDLDAGQQREQPRGAALAAQRPPCSADRDPR